MCVSGFFLTRYILIVFMSGWTTFIDWEKAADDEAVRNVSISTSAKWKELGEKRGLYIDYIYTNDASKDQSPIATYGEANIAKL